MTYAILSHKWFEKAITVNTFLHKAIIFEVDLAVSRKYSTIII
jgi:hypothetical protein